MKKITLLIIVLLGITILGCNDKNNTRQKNEVLAKSFIEAWSSHDSEKLASLFAPDFMYEEIGSGNKFLTKEHLKSYVDGTISGAPDLKLELVSLTCNDSIAVAEWTFEGTNTVGWPNIPPNNKTFYLRGVSVMEIKDNRITKNRDYWDIGTFVRAVTAE